MNLTETLLVVIAFLLALNMIWLAAIHGRISGAIERREKKDHS